MKTVHILEGGKPRCAFSDAMFPVYWPAGHAWVRPGDEHANCPGCLGKVVSAATSVPFPVPDLGEVADEMDHIADELERVTKERDELRAEAKARDAWWSRMLEARTAKTVQRCAELAEDGDHGDDGSAESIRTAGRISFAIRALKPTNATQTGAVMIATATLAALMFDAYNESGPNPWKTFDGRDVPRWDAVTEQVRAKWMAAAHEARLQLAKHLETQGAPMGAVELLRGNAPP